MFLVIPAVFALLMPTQVVRRTDTSPFSNVEMSPMSYDKAVLQLGTRLYKLATIEKTGNFFVSPLSAHLALSILANGVAGDAQSQMSQMLGMPVKSLNDQSLMMMQRANRDGGTILSLSNGVWAVGSNRLMPGYCQTVRDMYGAESGTIPEATGASLINAWVKSRTRNRIPSILETLGYQPIFVLVNALAFDGKWVSAFDEKATREVDFGLGETKSKVKMMAQTAQFPCGYWGTRPVLVLPYQGNYAMVAILPNQGESTRQVITELTPQAWSQFTPLLKSQMAIVSLPKFKIESSFIFTHLLGALGAPKLINGTGDFGPMLGHSGVQISIAIQKVYIDVDEKGTKAAAATAIVGRGFGGGPEIKTFTFNANRPFVVMLIERSTGVSLLLGAVEDPSK